ncbi:MAG: hypothetical protein KatS3mg065_0327 [Chloroflexota bacterium]|nr:MAG: hypothetical protein KatS3mg065_0327 [Chloroflexota bacterium]
MGHVRMMAAVQPFLSGAISKTVNMPESATVEDIEQVYLEGWRLGLKAIAIYRDGSKKSQPLTAGKKTSDEARRKEIEELRRQLAEAQAEALKPHRRRLPAERQAVTHKFEIAGHEGYITVGLYPDGQPGEIFLKMAKEGSTVSGLMDSFATAISLALQYGVPLRDLVEQVRPRPLRALGLHRQPRDPDRQVDRRLHLPVARLALPAPGRPGHARPGRPIGGRGGGAVLLRRRRRDRPGSRGGAERHRRGDASGPVEAEHSRAAGRRAAAGDGRPPRPRRPERERAGDRTAGAGNGHLPSGPGLALSLGGTKVSFQAQADAPSCPECGSIMVRNGSCYKCLNCGATSGCS